MNPASPAPIGGTPSRPAYTLVDTEATAMLGDTASPLQKGFLSTNGTMIELAVSSCSGHGVLGKPGLERQGGTGPDPRNHQDPQAV